MTAAIITIGDEILIGQITDTNSQYIAENLSLLGIEIREMRTISDRHEDIVGCLKDFTGRVELAIFTGGLGPTKDDITKKAFNDCFGGRLKENREVLDHIRSIFKNRRFKLSESNRLQATIPDNCQILKNREGTAPGMVFRKEGTIFVSVPGVPYEMKTIISEELIPLLAKEMNGDIILHRTIMTQGVPESYLSESIREWEEQLPSNLKLAYLPSPGLVKLRLSAFGKDRERLNNILQDEIRKLTKIRGKDIFAYDEIPLEKLIGDLLKEKGQNLVTAESCTGGNIAAMITSVPGSSEYFTGSVVAYSNEVKINELHVDPDVLQTKGAVSHEVVESMALNIRKKFAADYSIAVSGIAGPAGGSEGKPVGTTWIAVASSEKCVSKSFLFGDHRGRNIEKASQTALNMLRKMILGIE